MTRIGYPHEWQGVRQIDLAAMAVAIELMAAFAAARRLALRRLKPSKRPSE